jgi:1-phosphofructokinase
MIVTLTPNPSLDRTLQIEALVRGAVHRAVGGRVDPGGKGVNVSRALAANSVATTAVLPLGGPDGARLSELLGELGIAVRSVPVAGGVRSNITVAEPDGTTTKLNEPGPVLTPQEHQALVDAVLGLCGPDVWVVGSGSLPGGVPDTFYADLVPQLHVAGARVVIDSSGAAMAAVLARTGGPEAMPDLIKPNAEELAEAVDRSLSTLGEVVVAAQELAARGIATVLASLGADGAVLVSGDIVLHGEAPIDAPLSTVGAGDAALAGYLSRAWLGPGDGDAEAFARQCLTAALAWGSAATSLPGSRMPGPDDVAAIAVTIYDRVDEGRPLKG